VSLSIGDGPSDEAALVLQLATPTPFTRHVGATGSDGVDAIKRALMHCHDVLRVASFALSVAGGRRASRDRVYDASLALIDDVHSLPCVRVLFTVLGQRVASCAKEFSLVSRSVCVQCAHHT
jgi:hypothetical protein